MMQTGKEQANWNAMLAMRSKPRETGIASQEYGALAGCHEVHAVLFLNHI